MNIHNIREMLGRPLRDEPSDDELALVAALEPDVVQMVLERSKSFGLTPVAVINHILRVYLRDRISGP